MSLPLAPPPKGEDPSRPENVIDAPANHDIETTSSSSSHSGQRTAVADGSPTSRPKVLKEQGPTQSNWGEDVHVAEPMRTDDPRFFELRRSLTGSHHGEEPFSLEKTLQRSKERGVREKRLDVAWKHLSVRGVGAGAVFADDVGTMFNPLQKVADARRAKAAAARAQDQAAQSGNESAKTLGKNEKFLIHDFNGVLKSGEMALVVGRPGAGCTTFLKAVTNIRNGFAGFDGEVYFGNMDHKEAEKFPGQIVFNAEDDTHYPVLTVAQTLKFALKMKTPRERPGDISREEYEQKLLDTLLKTFGIEHTSNTLVGNEFVRGVSGGERKRVSLAEVLVNRASVVGWDNSSRGLDASTALEYTRSVRTITDVLGCTSFVSLYQAGNQIYDLFDKVCVIAAGECIFWGPRSDARPYFESLGFKCPPGQNIGDYLTGVTVATERIIFKNFQGQPPTSIAEFVDAYHNSEIYKRSEAELEAHLAHEGLADHTKEFKEIVKAEKAKSVSKRAPYTAGLWTQVKAATTRQFQLMWNDKGSIAIKQGSCITQSIILGSLFYNLPPNTSGLFTRGGALFFILLFNALLGMSEVTSSFDGRAILAKHKSFAMYRPSALILAQVLSDIPILIAQVTLFLLPIYFMCQLRQTAQAFFTLWAITYTLTLCLLGLFRSIGYSFSTFGGASQASGLGVGLLILYTGYLIPYNDMQVWLRWLVWLNPLYYGFEAAMVNEFHDTNFPCVGVSLVPSGGAYTTDGGNFACTVQGSVSGQAFVTGDAYLKAGLNYSYSHLGRNIGIIIAFWIFFIALTCFGVERLKAAGAQKQYLLFQRTHDKHEQEAMAARGAGDEEKNAVQIQPKSEQRTVADRAEDQIKKSSTVFTWKNLNYTVPVKGGHRQLLSEVQGYTKPGTLTALMGASGAGKTTLLDVLALRKEEGVVEGDINIDGRPLGTSFQRTTGYVSQMDIHEPTQTVREALVFSALLRQPRDVPEAEKIAYVDTVIDLLELNDIQNAFIGENNVGLGVEQRKRVTIGVELVSKPILLFLDEPTSGLDGQSSFNILRFLRKLADAGQSMLVTIHQPSALLFDQFDRLLLLARGGHTVYFGDLGDNGATMKSYFAANGIECPEDANPAEFMIDVVSGSLSKGKDWAKIWLESEEYRAVTQEVLDLNTECLAKPPSYEEDGLEYATTMATQFKLVIGRANQSMWRSTEYISSKIGLHIGSALVNSLTFLQLDNSVASLQNRLFSVFQGMFIAPGLLNQMQPRFLHKRMLFEAREKQSKMYHWFPFVVGELVAEAPWLIICGTIYYLLWYFVVFPVGISTDASHAGGMYAMLILYQFWILGFAFCIAAISGNEQQAALINPIFIGIFASFSGVLVPYPQITAFWRYWLYYINPWTYILGGEVFFATRNIPVVCTEREFARFPPPAGQTCGEYLGPFLQAARQGYVQDPSATDICKFCGNSNGNEFLATVNLNGSVIGLRNAFITILYAVFFFFLVFLAMRIRSKPKNKKSKA